MSLSHRHGQTSIVGDVAAPTCPSHGTPLVCPSCIGAAGGKRRSRAKAAAARKNARRPRPGARGKKKPRRKGEPPLRDDPKIIGVMDEKS